MINYSTVVIGGGAAGICAAISKGRRGEPVIICEKMPQLGKKILASGRTTQRRNRPGAVSRLRYFAVPGDRAPGTQ